MHEVYQDYCKGITDFNKNIFIEHSSGKNVTSFINKNIRKWIDPHFKK